MTVASSLVTLLPTHVKYFSFASFAQHEDVQLLIINQLIPGSVLLGYVNADHWSVAVSVEEKYSNRSAKLQEKDRILRDILFEAMVLFVIESLNKHSVPIPMSSTNKLNMRIDTSVHLNYQLNDPLPKNWSRFWEEGQRCDHV